MDAAAKTENGVEPVVACCMPMPSQHVPGLPLHNLRQVGGDDSATQALAVNRDYFWENGTSIHVRFLNRNPELERLVEEASRIWAKYANIQFVFDDAADAQIRICFDDMKGGRSQLGRAGHDDAPPDKPTMYLGSGLTKTAFQRTALHEFGHVLGCVHEHPSPAAHIKWNRDVVVAYYAKYGWPETWTQDAYATKTS